MNLLDRAKKLLRNRAADSHGLEESYHVACPDGHRLNGTRTTGYQALRCPTCGEGIFVLPRSPLPNPPAAEARAASRSLADPSYPINEDPISLAEPSVLSTASGADAIDIDWEESENHSPLAKTDSSGRDEQPIAHSEDSSSRRERESSETEPRVPGASARRQSPRTASASRAGRAQGNPVASRRREVRTPLAPDAAHAQPFLVKEWVLRRRNSLIFFGVVSIILGTVAVRLQRSRYEDYPRIAEAGRTEGLKALDEGRFDAAHLLLSRAKRAVVALGGHCEGADEILRGAAEADIFASLTSDTLESLIDDADPADDSGTPRKFATLFKGRTILIDAPLLTVPGENNETRHELEYRVFPNGEGTRTRREGRIDLTGFRLFQQAELKSGARVQFGARLATFTYHSGRDVWLIGLEPESGVFITHHQALKSLWPNIEDATEEARP